LLFACSSSGSALTESSSSSGFTKSEESFRRSNGTKDQESKETDSTTIEEMSLNTAMEDCSSTEDSGYGASEWICTQLTGKLMLHM